MSVKYREVKTQAELDAALARENVVPICVGKAWFTVRGSSSVVARDSSSVVAWGSSSVVAWGSSSVVAGVYVAVHKQSPKAAIRGGVVIEVPKITTGREWCDYYGIPVKRGIAVVFKAVDDEYVSSHGFSYVPGTKPSIPEADWDPSPGRDCGKGLHFCPHPSVAMTYKADATRFVACPVRVSDIVVYIDGHGVPDKVRARRVAGAVVEVDRWADPVVVLERAGADV